MPATAAPPLGRPSTVPHGSLRHRMRANPGLHQVWRVVIFVAGLLCVAAGFALAVLPGPLTIPPVLLGLWIWSTEFRWAQKLFQQFAIKARAAWQHAKQHPTTSAVITIGGIVAAVAAFWAVSHFDLIARARTLIGV